MLIKHGKIVDIMQKTLDYVDSRLVSHGKRVAYLVYKMLKTQNKYTDKQMRDICLLAMLHDIGAYKTEEIDKMVVFETVNIWEHSIYGYLFLKYFSPLRELSPVILFHHANCDFLRYLHPSYRELSQAISLCDRADIYAHSVGNDINGFRQLAEKAKNIKYGADTIELFFAANTSLDLTDKALNSDKEFNRVLYGAAFSEKEINHYIKMIILSIEFRSRQTALHTIAAACTARVLAGILGRSAEDIKKIATAAMLHDIGKTGTPVEILEKPDRLSDPEMKTMKSHVVISEEILAGSVDDEVLKIAVRHHEKLNGAGYPRGLNAEELSPNERLMAVADIFSALCGARSYKGEYPKEKTAGILSNMSLRGFIDPEITSVVIEHFDEIIESLRIESSPIIDMYEKINTELEQTSVKIQHMKDGTDFGGFLFGQECIPE